DRMDIREAERVILTNDLFRARPVLILPHHSVQGHARSSHEQVAIDIQPKGWWLGDQGLGDGHPHAPLEIGNQPVDFSVTHHTMNEYSFTRSRSAASVLQTTPPGISSWGRRSERS